MITFNAGAMRPANNETRAARIAAANDLVKRTLSQHGLMPGGDGQRVALNDEGADRNVVINFLSLHRNSVLDDGKRRLGSKFFELCPGDLHHASVIALEKHGIRSFMVELSS